MALILGALMIQGIVPGPQLISEHPDIFWGLIASFWIGNIILVVLNVPMIGLWVKLLTIPYKYLYPSAMFFVAIGVYSTNNDMFQVGEVVLIGMVGYLLLLLDFHPAPILLGFVLGPRFEENFRRAMLISRGDILVFVKHPISAVFIGLCALLIVMQIYVRLRAPKALPTEMALADRPPSQGRRSRRVRRLAQDDRAQIGVGEHRGQSCDEDRGYSFADAVGPILRSFRPLAMTATLQLRPLEVSRRCQKWPPANGAAISLSLGLCHSLQRGKEWRGQVCPAARRRALSAKSLI